MDGEKLDADRLNKIISNTDVLQNPKWAEIVELIKVKKSQGISIEKFQKAFKNANSHWDSDNGCPHKDQRGNDKRLSDGTIKLSDLKNNIRAL